MAVLMLILSFIILPSHFNCDKISSRQENIDSIKSVQSDMDCPGGTLLSSKICIPHDYRKGELPKMPVKINTAISINNIREIDDKKMTVSLEIHPQLIWADHRILTNFTDEERKRGIVLNIIYSHYIWKPDLFIENLSSFKRHSILEEISGFAIGNGLTLGMKNETIVWYEFSAKASIYCNFVFFRYPMDEQQCNFTVGSTYPITGAIVFTFHSSVFHFSNSTRSTDEFDLDIINVDGNGENNTNFGFTIRMNRRLQPFILAVYLPCITIIIVTHISFIIPIDAVPGRIGLLVTQFLTLTNICIHQQSASPSAGQFTALGIYLLVCVFFVAGAMIEYAVLLHLKRNSEHKDRQQSDQTNGATHSSVSKRLLNMNNDEDNKSYEDSNVQLSFIKIRNDSALHQKMVFLNKSNRIDNIALLVFSLAFSLFNSIYWIYYLYF